MRQVAVLGLGRFGSSVARTLVQSGCEVLAVDADAERVKALVDEVTEAVQADVLNDAALKSMGLRNFEAVVVAIGQDVKASILVTVMLKEMGVKKIVAKAQDDLHGKVLQKVGADVVVYPERDMGVRLAHTLLSRSIIDEIQLSSDHSIFELQAPARFLERSLKDLQLRQRFGLSLLAVRRGEEVLIAPDGNFVLEQADILVALGRPERLEHLGD
jgi:trk system potassium uptake protein TrkA